MEHLEGEQYSQYTVERNPIAYMSMRDYRNPPWVSAPSYMVPPQYAPPPHPQSISPIEQAILNLTKLVGDVVEEQKKFNAQLSKKIHTVENSLNHRIDGLQYSISNLSSQQHAHQEGENPKGECLIDTTMEEQYKQQDEAISPLLTEEGSGQKTVEGTQKPLIKPIPINLYPSAITQPKNRPLPATSSLDPMYTLPIAQPTPAAQFTPEAPTTKATSSLPMLQNFKKLVATVQNFSTTSKKMAAAHTAWHSGWFGYRFEFGAPEPAFLSFVGSNSLQRPKEVVWGVGEHSLPHFLF